jgi:hypothetical protein
MDKVKQVLIDIGTCFVIFLIGFFLGYWKAPVKTVTVPKESVATVDTKTNTEVQYVPKTSAKDSDVEVTQKTPTVSVNGKQYVMQKLPTETNKFEKGKVTVEQGYTIDIKAKDLVPPTPKWGLDIGYSNHGIKTGIEYNFNKNVAMYAEGTPVPSSNRDRYFGAGLKVRF